MVLETNIDDMSAEIYSFLFGELFAAGALDVFLTNIIMKKNRPGIKLNVLAKNEDLEVLENIIFRETTTLGIRKYQVARKALKRKFFDIQTEWGPVKIKAAYKDGELVSYNPEYEDCKTIAEKFELPLKKVYTKVKQLANNKLPPDNT
ncbi:MAG: nickel insertion protein [Bacillota bacterium]